MVRNYYVRRDVESEWVSESQIKLPELESKLVVHSSNMYLYISATMPRIMMADWNETIIEMTVGMTCSLRLAMMNSAVVRWRPPVSAWYTPIPIDMSRKMHKMNTSSQCRDAMSALNNLRGNESPYLVIKRLNIYLFIQSGTYRKTQLCNVALHLIDWLNWLNLFSKITTLHDKQAMQCVMLLRITH